VIQYDSVQTVLEGFVRSSNIRWSPTVQELDS